MKDRLSKYINRETVTYLIFGVLTTAVNYIVYYGLRALSVHYLIANTLAWIAAVVFAFFTNKRYGFESRDYTPGTLRREFFRFVAGRLLTLGIEQLFLLITVEWLGLNDRIMKLVISVIVVILNYVFSKLFIFNKEKSDEN